MRRPRVMRTRIRATSLVPKRTAIQKPAMEAGRRDRSSASRLPWMMVWRRNSRAYERKVSRIMARHGGVIERAIRSFVL